jgi:Zn finger protein HypA/HybF involved in hydrogenase expression
MHDFMLAKEIVDEVLKIAQEKNLSKINRVSVDIGQIAMAHDGHDEHVEDISEENLRFGIAAVAKGTILENTVFEIKKVQGDHWNLNELDGE